MTPSPESLVQEFVSIAKVAGILVPPTAIRVETWPAPHRPKGLPDGWMAAYAFMHGDSALKVGKAGRTATRGTGRSTTSSAARTATSPGHVSPVAVTSESS